MNHTDTERTIDLRNLFFRILKRWRLLLVLAVLGFLAGAAYKYLRGGKTVETVTEAVPALSVPMTDEEYAHAIADYERDKAMFEDAVRCAQEDYDTYMAYWDGSILTKIDPYDAPCANARLVVSASVSDRNAPDAAEVLANGIRYIVYTLDGRLEEAELFDQISALTGEEARYLREVVRFDIASSEDALEVHVYYTDPETAEKILDLILDYAKKASNGIRQEGITSYKVESFKGYSGRTVSEELSLAYNYLSQNRVTLRTTLDTAKAGLSALIYPEPYRVLKAETATSKDVAQRRPATLAEILKFAVLFGVAFFLLGAVVIALRLLFPYKVLSAGDAERSLALPVFADYGSLSPKHSTHLDKWIQKKLEGKTYDLDTDGHSQVVRVASETLLHDADALYLLSTSGDDALDSIAESLQKALPDLKVELLKNVLSDPECFGELEEGSAAMIVEKLEKAAHSGIVSELNYLKSRGASVKGCIVYE